MAWEIVHWGGKWRSVSRCQAIGKESRKNTPRPGLMLALADRTERREKCTEQERAGERERGRRGEVGHRLKIWMKIHCHCWRFSHRVCITGFKRGVCYTSMWIDHWHNFVGVITNLVATCWRSITPLPSAQFTWSFHGEIHIDWHKTSNTDLFPL